MGTEFSMTCNFEMLKFIWEYTYVMEFLGDSLVKEADVEEMKYVIYFW